MAITYVAAGSQDVQTNTALTLGIPAGCQADDILIASVVVTQATADDILAPSGWTQIDSSLPGGKLIAFWKRHSGSEPSTYTFDSSYWGGTGFALGKIVAFRGCRTSSSPISASSAIATGSTTSVTANALTTLNPSEMVLFIGATEDSGNFPTPGWTGGGSSNASGYTGTDPTFTEAFDTYYSGVPDAPTFQVLAGLFLAYGTKSTAGSTGTRTATLAAVQSSQAFTVSLAAEAAPVSSDAAGGYAVLIQKSANKTGSYIVAVKTTNNKVGQYAVQGKINTSLAGSYFALRQKMSDKVTAYFARTTPTKDASGKYSLRAAATPKSQVAQYTVANAGAGSKSVVAGYYILVQIEDPSSPVLATLTLPDPDTYTAADRDPWRPKLYPGDFFVGGERYHIYASKKTKTLGEITFSVFQLAATPVRGTAVVTYNSLAYSDFFIFGNELHLKWRDPQDWAALAPSYGSPDQAVWIDKGYLGKPANPIHITYDYITWNSTTKVFDTNAGDETLTIKDDEERRYYRIYDDAGELDRELGIANSGLATYKWYGPRLGPTVLTDSSIQDKDAREVVQEFAVEPETGYLSFAADNLVRNPSFEIVDASDVPYEWTIGVGLPVTAQGSFPSQAAHANRYLSLPESAELYQQIRLRKPGPLTVSFYARVSAGAPSLKVVLNPIGVLGTYLDANGTSSGITPYLAGRETLSASKAVTGTDWVRYTAVFSDDSFFTPDASPVPDETLKVELRLVAIGGSLHIDALQLESGSEAHAFSYVDPNATVEYESAPDSNWVPVPDLTKAHPYKRDDVDLNPCESVMPNGFLCFLDDGETGDEDLTKGGTGIYVAGGGPQDQLGRYHLPYAKLSGIQKLQRRATFHLSGSPPELEALVDAAPLVCKDVDPIIPDLAYIEESVAPIDRTLHIEVPAGNGTELSVLFKDQFGNPLFDQPCTITHIGASGTFGYTEKTDQAGRVSFSYSRQTGSSGVAAETVEFSIDGVSFTFTVDVT